MQELASKSNINNSGLSNATNSSINMGPGGTDMNHMAFNNSISGMIGKNIRTNLNNIDYASSGTMYRRPQLHPSIYEHSVMSANSNNDNVNKMIQNEMISLPKAPPPMIPPHQHHLQYQQQQIHSKFDYDMTGGNNFEFDQELDDDIIPDWVPLDRCLEKVITTFDYEGQREDELSFKENMYIFVIKKNDDHWYEGIMKNENGDVTQGLYPFNYARCIRKYTEDSKVSQC